MGTDIPKASVAVLNVHMEGNLGDEYETTPLLATLSKWGAHVDLYLANWQPEILEISAALKRGLISSRVLG